MVDALLKIVPAQAWIALAEALMGAAITWVIGKIQKSNRLTNLALIVQVAGQAAQDALKAWTPGQTKAQIISAAAASAKADLLAALPELEKSLEAELDTLIHGTVARTVLTTPGGAQVAMPLLVPGAN